MTAVAPESAAYNAMLSSYAGQSLNPANPLPRSPWWTEERIQAVVTVEFIAGKLKNEERRQLNRPLSFGDGLTSDTYLDFILERAKTFFLVLSEIGIPGRIFSIIDLSYDDSDLPIPREIVPKLALSSKPDEKLNRKFFDRQHQFMLREMQEGEHTEYEPFETVPLEFTCRLPADVALHSWMRVRLPRAETNEVLGRRRLAMGSLDGEQSFPEEFWEDLATMRHINHDHIVPVWSSYSFKGAGYILTPFIAHRSLKDFIEICGSPEFQRMSRSMRRKSLFQWLHCLADALAYMHLNGFHHTAIRPSNIVIDVNHKIAFSDVGSLKTFQKDKVLDPMEAYNYGAPEAHLGERHAYTTTSKNKSVLRLGLFRKHSSESKYASDDSLNGSYGERPVTSSGRKRANTLSSTFSSSSNGSTPSIAPTLPSQDSQSIKSGVSSTSSSGRPTEKSDIFSLGCVFLSLLSLLQDCKPNEMTKYIRSMRKGSTKWTHGNTVFDSSFHGNLCRVHLWANVLDEKAKINDRGFRATHAIIHLVRSMLSHDQDLRPTAAAVRDELYRILTSYAGFDEHDQLLHYGSYSSSPQSMSYSSYLSGAPLESPTMSTSVSDEMALSWESSRLGSGYSDASQATSVSVTSAGSNVSDSSFAAYMKRESTPPNFSRLLPRGVFGETAI